MVRSVRPTLLVLLGTVGFVLLIACATISNLMLARAVSRRKEMALRLALGARRGDLIRMKFVEVLALSCIGGLAGVLLGTWALEALSSTLPPGSIPRQTEVSFDGIALWFTAGVTLLSALLAGLIPALQTARAALHADLKAGNRGSSQGAARNGTRSLLVAAEVALSLVLLAGAGLMVRTMHALQSVDAGFNPGHLLTMQIAVSGTDFVRDGRRANLFHEVRDRITAVPGVETASAINHLPLGGDIWGLDYTTEGRPKPAPGDEFNAVYRVAMPNYFHTMQIGLLQGRDSNSHDNGQNPDVAVINEAMARRQWPGQSAVGKQVHFGITPEEVATARTIVGVIRNAQQDWTSAPPGRDLSSIRSAA